MDVMSSSRRKTEASRPLGSYGCIHSTTEASPLVAGPESHAWKTVKRQICMLHCYMALPATTTLARVQVHRVLAVGVFRPANFTPFIPTKVC